MAKSGQLEPAIAGRAVVTGGAGFVGSHVCEALLRRGWHVVCVDNIVTGAPSNVSELDGHERFELLNLDVSDGLDVQGPVDWVLHLASPASPVHYLRLPVETLKVGSLGTTHALELAREHSARFLLASTSEVYGDPLEHPQREEYWGNVNLVGPRSVYDVSKRFAEAITTAYRTAHQVDTAIVRIFNTYYGPRMRLDDGRVVPTFIDQALSSQPFTVAGDGFQTRSVCYVTDTVAGILAMAASGEAGPVNIGNPVEMTILALAEIIGELSEAGSAVEYVTLPTDDPRQRCPDISKAERLLGWTPSVSARDGLRTTIDWYAAQR